MAAQFTAREREIALAVAEAMLPAGRIFRGADARTVERLQHILVGYGGAALRGYGALLQLVEHAALARHGRRFSKLPLERREAFLQRMNHGSLLERSRLTAIASPLKTAHFDDPAFYTHFGCVWGETPKAEPKPRWWSQVQPGAELEETEIECDAVVVGTGAGGAVVAKELAEAGLAVVMLEEGAYHGREEFSGRTVEMMGKLYRNAGATYSLGNTLIPIPLGKTVGGTTTINCGTSFRTPDRVLARWRSEFGLRDLTPEAMEPYFAKVERELQIADAKLEHLGAAAGIVARGADALGWSHHPLRRNAPDCDGQGVCMFGCPTDAKRSTNVSYVPMALQAAAMLITGARASRVLVEGGRAVGVEARLLGADRGRALKVRARATVLACGALLTPVFLLKQKLLPKSRELGRNLTIHPAINVMAEFESDSVRGWEHIPQGYCVDEFHEEGILMESQQLPLDGGAVSINLVGRRLIELMEGYDRVGGLGAMIAEKHSTGRVSVLPGGLPLTTYWLHGKDLAQLQHATGLIGDLLFAAGAKRLFPLVQRFAEIGSPEALERFRRAKLAASDFLLTAHHPLSTCRMGADPARSVVGPDHEAHELPGLYVCDGSAVPSSPTVNPQVTIMSLATRAAGRIAEKLG